MGIELRRCERSVPQQLLDGSQVGPSLEQMRSRCVTQCMRTEIGSSVHFSQPSVNRPTNGALIYPRAARTEEHRCPGFCSRKRRAAVLEPAVEGRGGR